MGEVSQECFEQVLCKVVVGRLLDTTAGKKLLFDLSKDIEVRLADKLEKDRIKIIKKVADSLGIKKTHLEATGEIINREVLSSRKDFEFVLRGRIAEMLNEMLSESGESIVASALRGSVAQKKDQFTVTLTIKKA